MNTTFRVVRTQQNNNKKAKIKQYKTHDYVFQIVDLHPNQNFTSYGFIYIYERQLPYQDLPSRLGL